MVANSRIQKSSSKNQDMKNFTRILFLKLDDAVLSRVPWCISSSRKVHINHQTCLTVMKKTQMA